MAAYVTVEEYVAAFGAQEAKRITNDIVGGEVDSAKVQAALDDQTETIDGYISRRYAVPLVSPPTIVKGWVKALAREQLATQTGRTTEAIKQAADLVRGQLKDLVNSKMDLPISEIGGDAPVATALGLASSSDDRPCPVFVGNPSLERYMSPFTGRGSSVPNWRR